MNVEIQQGLVDALAPVVSAIESDFDVTVARGFVFDATAAIVLDVWPATPFREPLGFSPESKTFWTVRARAGTAERIGSQDVLLRLMEDDGETSVSAALEDDQTLGGVADSVAVSDLSGFQPYVDPAGRDMVGVAWTVTVLNRPEPTT